MVKHKELGCSLEAYQPPCNILMQQTPTILGSYSMIIDDKLKIFLMSKMATTFVPFQIMITAMLGL